MELAIVGQADFHAVQRFEFHRLEVTGKRSATEQLAAPYRPRRILDGMLEMRSRLPQHRTGRPEDQNDCQVPFEDPSAHHVF